MDELFTRQVRGQGTARRLLTLPSGGRHARGGCRNVRLELFEGELELRDLALELLGGAAEAHTTERGELDLEPFDLEIARGEKRLLLKHETLETLEIIGQCEPPAHGEIILDRIMQCTRKHCKPSYFRSINAASHRTHRPLEAALGMTPVDPLEQHRELRTRERYRALTRLRPGEATALETLAKQT